jgi:hypothetical protein
LGLSGGPFEEPRLAASDDASGRAEDAAVSTVVSVASVDPTLALGADEPENGLLPEQPPTSSALGDDSEAPRAFAVGGWAADMEEELTGSGGGQVMRNDSTEYESDEGCTDSVLLMESDEP